jgi:hypothetical protein
MRVAKMKKSAIFTLSSNEVLSAVGDYLMNKKCFEKGEYDRIVAKDFRIENEWHFEVYKDDAEPKTIAVKENKKEGRLLRPEKEEN